MHTHMAHAHIHDTHKRDARIDVLALAQRNRHPAARLLQLDGGDGAQPRDCVSHAQLDSIRDGEGWG